MGAVRKRSGLIGVSAHYVTCGWQSEARNAAGTAARHAAASFHEVHVQQVTITLYNVPDPEEASP